MTHEPEQVENTVPQVRAPAELFEPVAGPRPPVELRPFVPGRPNDTEQEDTDDQDLEPVLPAPPSTTKSTPASGQDTGMSGTAKTVPAKG